MQTRLKRKLSSNSSEMEITPIPSLESSSEEQTTDTEENDQRVVLRNGRLRILTSVYALYTLHPVPPLQGHPEFEIKAKLLFDDIFKHEHIWFRQIFNLEQEVNGLLYCERVICVIDTYATIQHQRGKIESAYKLLLLSDHILSMYKDISISYYTSSKSTLQVYYSGVLAYKHNVVLVNVHTQFGSRKRAVKAFREIVKYEIGDKNGAEIKNMALILPILYGPEYINLTETILDEKVTDEQIWFALKESIYDPLARCKKCYKKENFKSEFRTCSKCKKVFYCSRECQKAHWKDHKNHCCQTKASIQTMGRRNGPPPSERSITNLIRKELENREKNNDGDGSGDDEDYTMRQNIALGRIMELMQKINVQDKSDS